MKNYLSALIYLAFAILLTACSGNAIEGTSAGDSPQAVDTIKTYAVQTIEADLALQSNELPPPTSTPLPTATLFPTSHPTEVPATAPTTTAYSSSYYTSVTTSCDDSTFVSDITIPDYTVLAPGESFVKTWSLYNSGSCTWTENFGIGYVGGDLMGGVTTLLNQSVAPGVTAEVSISLTAPTTAGEYTGYWRLVNELGEYFGHEVFVVIVVNEDATVTPTPTATSEFTPTPTNTPEITTESPTETPIPTATIEPTATPEPPEPSDTAIPTETPVPTEEEGDSN